MKTLVVGWGNPIGGDDAVGLRAADAVAEKLVASGRDDVDVIGTSDGGFRLAERALGYDRVVVLDARVSESACAGGGSEEGIAIRRIAPRELSRSEHPTRHDGTLADAFRGLAALWRDGLPREAVLMSVPIVPPHEWSERISDDAEAAAKQLARAAFRELEEIQVA